MIQTDDKMRVLIVGGGLGGKAMLELFAESEDVLVVGLVDVKGDAPGIEMAEELGVPTSNTWKNFLAEGKVDVIVDVTGVLKVHETLQKEASETCDLVAGNMARFFWALVHKHEHQENYLRIVIDSFPHPFYVINVSDYTVVMANTVARGDSEKGVVTCYAMIHGRSEPCSGEHTCPLEKVRRTGETVVVEDIYFDRDGHRRNVEVNAHPIFNKRGELTQVIEYLVDITDRKKAESALKESEEKFRRIFDCSNDGMLLVDPKDKSILMVNKKMCDVLGYTEEEILGFSISDIHPKKNLSYVFEQFEGQARGEIEVAQNIPVLRKDGSVFYADVNSTPITIEGRFGLLGVFRDITDKKRAEDVVRNSERHLKEAQRVASIGHWELDPKVGTPTWSEEIFHIFGLDPEESEPSFVDNKTHIVPEDWPILNDAVTKGVKDGTSFDIMFRLIRPDKEIRWMHAIGNAAKDGDGNVTRLYGTAQDVTDLKRVENELRIKMEEIEKLNRLMIGREGRILEVKNEVNSLLEELGREPKYAG